LLKGLLPPCYNALHLTGACTKSQTNFYIPDEYYVGYSYLFVHEKQPEWHSRSHIHARHPAFVYAQSPTNLHPRHYISNGTAYSTHMPKITFTAVHSITDLTSLASDSTHNALHYPHHSSPILPSQNANSNINHALTVPYIHPHLEMPVPPLHLPWYFGALCWSFSLAAAIMLYLPPKWTLCGGGRVSGRREEYKRHWFPYRTFALILMLCQSPCSFLADYVHMTNISLWHTIDRFIACIMMALELVKLIALCPYTRPPIYLLYLACCGGAVFCFMKSQKSQETLNVEGFVFWHCGWHCYPIACAVVYLVENFLNQRWGEYYAFECEAEREMKDCKYKRGEKGGILLSTIVMNNWNNLDDMLPKDQYEASNNDTTGGKEWEQIQTSVKAKRVVCHDGEIASSFTDTTNGMASPGLRRSSRIAGQKANIQREENLS